MWKMLGRLAQCVFHCTISPARALRSSNMPRFGVIVRLILQAVFLYVDFPLRNPGIILKFDLNGLILAHQKYFYIYKAQRGSWFSFFWEIFQPPKKRILANSNFQKRKEKNTT